MLRPLLRFATVAALAFFPAGVALAQPATRPATRASGVDAAFVARLVDNLRDADPQVRGAARRALLGLDLADVPLIADALRHRPAAEAGASQIALVVREALDHLYLRRAKGQYHALRDAGGIDDPYFRDGGFLGIRLPMTASYDAADLGDGGVTVVGTLPGFNAYEVLEPGDILVELDVEGQVVPLTNPPTLREAVANLRPGEPVELRLVRGGEVLRLPFRLDRVVNTDSSTWQQLSATAKRDAEAAWQEQFAPLLDRPARADAAE